MNLFSIAWKSIRQRWLASSLTALSVALGVALMATVLVINGVVTRVFSQSATGYHLVVGAKGSPMQLVLNTIYFMDRPIENLPYKYYLQLKKNAAVDHAVPFALGDTTQDARFRIAGTIPEYFELEYVPGKKFEFASGKVFAAPDEAVVGARVARAYGWTVGQVFPIAHGGNVEDVHAEKFKVVGILKPTGTPSDRVVFLNLEGFYQMDGHQKPLADALAKEKAFNLQQTTEPVPSVPQGNALPDEQKEVTAILIKTKGTVPTLAILLANRINEGPIAQATNPIEQIGKLLRNVVGNVRTMLVVMTTLIIIVSGVSIFVSIYNSMADRRREIAIMRALGASRTMVFSIIVAESILLCVGGGVLGLILGHAIVFVAGPIVESRSDILIDPWYFEPLELALLPALLVLAAIVGMVPGMTAYRTDVARGLAE